MRRSLKSTGLAAMLVIALMSSSIAQAQDTKGSILAQVTVSGEGMIQTLPDMANVEFAIVTRSERPDVAQTENENATAEALNAVRAMGIAEKDIRLQNVQLGPLREYDPDRRTYLENGFEATRSLLVTVRDLDTLPGLVATLVENGANRMNSIQYGLDNRDEIELQVLRLAVARAKAKASVMARELGREVGAIKELSEQGFSFPSPVIRMEAAYDMASKGAGNPDAYASGQIEVRATVMAVFVMK